MKRWICLGVLAVAAAAWAAEEAALVMEDFSVPGKWRLSGKPEDLMTYESVTTTGPAGEIKAGKFTTAKDVREQAQVFFLNDKAGALLKDKGKDFSGISFLCKGDGSNNLGVIQLLAYGYKVRFVACFPLNKAEWTRVQIPWSEFVDLWDQTPDPGAKFDFASLDAFAVDCRRPKAACSFQMADLKLEKFDPPKDAKGAGSAETLSLARLAKKLAAKEKITYVAMGDSITMGVGVKSAKTQTYEALVGDQLKEKFGGEVNVVNAGFGGDIAEEGRVRLGSDCLIHKPDLVTIFFGANDTIYNLSKDTYKRTVFQMIRDIRNTTDADIVLITPPTVKDQADITKRYVEALHELSKECNVPVAEVNELFTTLGEKAKPLYRDDNCHLLPTGHEKVAEVLLGVIEKAK